MFKCFGLLHGYYLTLQYQLVVEALEGGTGSKTLPSGQNHVQTLAKAQVK